jgi:hypothetical protein
MKLSALLAPLVAAKADHETIMAVVLAYEAEQGDALEKRRESDRLRQEAKRRSSRDSRDPSTSPRDRSLTGGGVTRVEDKTSNSKIEPQEVKGVAKTRPTRLPENFVMPVEWGTWAIAEGLPPERVPIEFKKLCNWAANAAGAKGAKSNWFKAWQNWVLGAIDNLKQARAGPAKAPNIKDFFSAAGAANADRLEPHEPPLRYISAAAGR